MNFFLALALFFSPPLHNMQSLKYHKWKTLQIPEPSGICVTDDNRYFIASDNGVFCEIDGDGDLLRSKALGMDIEDVCAVGNELYVIDESLRLVYVLDEDSWNIIATHYIPYSGARNLSFESITYLPEKKHFIAITEKQPSLLFELDSNFAIVNQFPLTFSNDVSGATYFDSSLWILSDEDHRIFQIDPNRLNQSELTIERIINIPIYNPEGICFDTDGTMRIVSDDMHRLYIFSNPEQ